MSNQAQDVPAWFSQQLAQPYKCASAVVQGCTIQYAIWGSPHKPGLILVHGGLAHLHWWRFLAPFWLRDYRVIALDISGHGDSGWRNGYDAEVWAEEIVAAIKVADFKDPPIVIGHSLGGLLSLTAAALNPPLFAGLIMIDSPVMNFEKSKAEGRRGNSYLHILPYPSLAGAKKRFRLLPSQPVGQRHIFDFLAENSLKRVAEGWIWKFDPSVFVGVKRPKWTDLLSEVSCPMAFIRGENSSIATMEMRGDLIDHSQGRLAMVDIPFAYHHIMLDQPLALVASISALLAAWQCSPA